jgi:dihydrofolate synthase/folylpolyglutamate synthase
LHRRNFFRAANVVLMSTEYKNTLDYLYARLPMFQRIGAAAYKANLDNTHAICNMLRHPERKFKSIHIAGTNGKGSTSHMLAAILQSQGFKVGLYTSPHLKDFRERIRINGNMIPEQRIVKFVKQYRKGFEKIEPSFFEWTVGLAFQYFAEEKVDIAVIETGLGGRLDSTNVLTPLVSVITNISYDHMNLLGNSLTKIATEKAGIIKPGVPVVIGESQWSVSPLFRKVARNNKSPLFFADKRFSAKESKWTVWPGHLVAEVNYKKKKFMADLHLELSGHYQLKNIRTVLQTVELLNHMGFGIREGAIRIGLENVSALTGLRGRWETLSTSPLTIADTGHNIAGIKEVLKQIQLTPHRKLFFVLGMVNDKDINKILKLLPKTAYYFFCKASVPRALDAKLLHTQAKAAGLKGQIIPNVKKALKAAQKKAGKADLVFVGGSTFTVGDAI